MPNKNNRKPVSKSKPRKASKTKPSPGMSPTARISGQFEGNITASGKLHIAPGARCRANIRASGVNIDGDFEGHMATQGSLRIGNKARCKGWFKANTVQVDGSFVGEAFVNGRMDLTSNAAMKGHIVASRLVVADGASFDGRCTVGKFASEQNKTKKAA
jgi:cytoskeletal protein CcmA (bactofilin family)